jgi:cytochrome c peroxidase
MSKMKRTIAILFALGLLGALRNVTVTQPYFHDGTVGTLEDATSRMGTYQLGRQLAVAEVRQLVAFMGSLTGTYEGRRLDDTSAAAQ